MRVLMLGWEFPPFISGGLGTACYGLTKALSRHHTPITFVLPKRVGSEYHSHVHVMSPQSPRAAQGDRTPQAVASSYRLRHEQKASDTPTQPHAPREHFHLEEVPIEEFRYVTFKAVPSLLANPYSGSVAKPGTQPGSTQVVSSTRLEQRRVAVNPTSAKGLLPRPVREPAHRQPISVLGSGPMEEELLQAGVAADYSGDLLAEAQRYAALCVDLCRGVEFDVIHAHDWLTFPAAQAVAAVSGKPLVVHIHSTELDRSPDNPQPRIYDIERRGMLGATRVICVSHWTRAILEANYLIPAEQIDVVYNGIENGRSLPMPNQGHGLSRDDKIVLFLGRITAQKGPEFFVDAAEKVLSKNPHVKFIMAGSGDQAQAVIEMAAERGLGQHILFTGFLRGADVDRVFDLADVYVMPSVSEPFGIAALEAIANDVPVIVSKQSGVSEVLKHALKFDYWNTDELADKILAVLAHAPLSEMLREQADLEIRRLTWDDAARKCLDIYRKAHDLVPD